jgi:hypothetical protein
MVIKKPLSEKKVVFFSKKKEAQHCTSFNINLIGIIFQLRFE